ncbi:MAG: outer membrane beta-barrel protein [Nonlabens sp.]
MKLPLVLILACLCGMSLQAQSFEISGIVRDSLTKEPLQSATVYLESVRDTTLIAYSITDVDGAYKLQGNTAYEKVNFMVNYQGYKNYLREIDLTKDREMTLPDILLSDDIEKLADVLVVAKKAPITVKQDTLEFNAKSFNTQPDATLEDIMKELPGVKVDKDGKITVNGKEVSRILVNGKEFFGDDPKIALKNLPKEIIDKIQVTDSKTEEQKAAGEDGDENVSEINITIDKDKNKGWFSRFTAGIGTQDRYSMSGIANYFNNDLKISILGSSNNINSPGFSFDEIYDAMGGGGYSITTYGSGGGFGFNGVNFGGTGGGITSSRSGGVNISNDWGKKVSARADYFYGGNSNRSASDSRRTTFLPDRSFNTNNSSRSNSDGNSHRTTSRVTIKPDTLTTVRVEANATFSDSANRSVSNSTSSDATGAFINEVMTDNNGNSDDRDLGTEISYTRRSKKKGNYYSVNAGLDRDDSDSDRLFNSSTLFADGSLVLQDQSIKDHTDNTRFNLRPSGRLKLDDTWSLSGSYSFNARLQNNKRDVFDRDVAGTGLVFNPTLSTDFAVQNQQHRPRAGVRYKTKKLTVEFTGGLLYQTLDSEDDLRGIQFDKSFADPYVRFSLSKQFGKFGRVYLQYNNAINIPNFTQLQPFEDRTDPNNIRTGNPDLDASQTHNVSFNASNYNWEKGSGFYSGGSLRYSNNSVASFSLIDDNLIRSTTFVNVDGEYNGYLYSSFNKNWNKDKRDIGFEVGLSAGYNLDIGFNNGVQFETSSINWNPNIGFNYSYDDVIDVNLDYRLSNTQTRFTNISTDEQDFTNHTASIDIKTFWPENLIFGIRGEYQKFGNVTDDFDDDSIVLIGSIGYKFSKDRANIKLKAYDLLDQIINNRRSVGNDFVVDTSSLVLTQYFMLSFTYKLSKFGGKDPNSDTGGVIMM